MQQLLAITSWAIPLKPAEARMAEIAVLRTHIVNYARTRPVYDAYRKKAGAGRVLGTPPERNHVAQGGEGSI